MADTYYAWSPIHVGAAKEDQLTKGETKVIAYGDTVTASALGGEDELKAKLESGAVRTTKPPEVPDTFQGSPVDFVRQEREREDNALLATTGGSIFAPDDSDVLLGETNLAASPDGGKKVVEGGRNAEN